MHKDRGNNSDKKETYYKILLSDFIGESIPISCINTTLPIIKVIQSETKNHTCEEIDVKWFLKILSGIDLTNPETIINNQIVLFERHRENRTSTAFASAGKSGETNFPVISRNGARNTGIDKPKTGVGEIGETKNIQEGEGRHSEEKRNPTGIRFKNETGLSIDTEQLLNEELNIDLSGEEPRILIVHAHTSESYTPTEKFYYAPTDPDRTEDASFNVARVGEEIAKHLMEKGINVVHDKTIHDYPSYSGSYQRALETTIKQLEKYPSIEVVLDIHRDGFIYGDGSKLRTATNIEGKPTSKVMFVIGTNQRGLHHPNGGRS